MNIRLITITPDSYGLSGCDVELARHISAVARDLGMTADHSALQTVQLAFDALVIDDVLPFWRAVLGYAVRGDRPVELNDPRGRGPIVEFGQMDAPRPQRNRIHFNVCVPQDQAEARVAAAIAAGGHLVTDQYAPAWWVLADAEGNEACVGSLVGDMDF